VGYVTSLDFEDPRTDPHHVFQSFKQHPFAAGLLEGGKLLRYGAKTLPYSGWLTMPRLAGEGWMIAGDSGGFLNSQRLKGIHLAIKSGMLAAESAYEALVAGRFDAQQLGSYKRRVDASWIRQELYPVRNFHQGFEHGLEQVFGGHLFSQNLRNRAGYQRMKPMAQAPAETPRREAMLGNAKGDGRLSFDRLTDVFYSGTRHEEDQPTHLTLSDPAICTEKCAKEFGNPCQYFCPAAVYEMVGEDGGEKRLQIHFANCVHCKTCDILDPYQIIRWVPPEGGGGPNYDGM
jgi:electron-transferring-flavoprotein dehydrogenase